MSLSTRMILGVLVSALCTAMLGGAAVVGMAGMRAHFDAAADRYDELRFIYEVGHHAALVRESLFAAEPDRRAILDRLGAASAALDKIRSSQPEDAELRVAAEAIGARLDRVASLVAGEADPSGVAGELEATLGRVATLAGAARAGIIERRREAAASFERALWVMAGLFVAAIAIGVAVGLVQRRAVMRPVRSLDRAARQLARADFGHRIPERGARELRALIRRFNEMNDEIRGLHESMRGQIETKSAQLVRSERLAGLGRLAAGVAHEINNPLAIIAGHAESAARALDRRQDADPAPRARRALSIIAEEAFRCREITRDLLDLASPRDGRLEPIDVAAVARRAVALARGLPAAGDRTIDLRIEPDAVGQSVLGQEAPMLQVMINLIANALESTEPGVGAVRLAVERRERAIAVVVADNGCGMSPETLAEAFDPFSTDKPQRGLTGCGLGLSISHAIVERLGGKIDAQSPGVGKGSVFTVSLPVRAPAGVCADV